MNLKTMPKPLGRQQIGLLQTLDNPPYHYERGVWGPRSGWTWGTKTSTERLLRTLEKRGLISSTPDPGDFPTYRLTKQGEETIRQLRANKWKAQ